jgi:hypothetical protein
MRMLLLSAEAGAQNRGLFAPLRTLSETALHHVEMVEADLGSERSSLAAAWRIAFS